MYPLDMTTKATSTRGAGFAVANDEADHKALTAAGYEPKFVAVVKKAVEVDLEPEEPTRESVMAELDAADIAYDKRLSLAKLKALLP